MKIKKLEAEYEESQKAHEKLLPMAKKGTDFIINLEIILWQKLIRS